MVVARPDVHVVAHAVTLAADDQQALRVRLERGQAVHHVHARLLHGARPVDVRPLVEARLHLHHAHRLLAALGGADQRRDERRVVARPVHGLLDREHVGVGDGLLDEALDRARERVVGMVEQDVALAHRRHHVGLLALVGQQPRLGDGGPRLVAQVGVAGHAHDVPQVLQVEQPGDLEHVLVLGAQGGDDLLAHRRAHAGADLDAHDLAEAAPAQLVLDRPHQVVRLVGDGEVRVAGDAEDGVVDDLHAREQVVEVLGDQVLERDERAAVADRDEARQHLLRHLHAREGLQPADRVAHEHAEREREVRDVGERPPEADGQRRQHREDLAGEALVEHLPLRLGDLVVADDADAVLGQPGRMCRSRHSAWRSMWWRTSLRSTAIVSLGVRPSCSGASMPASIWSCRPATRTMKNSSRLLETIAQNFSRSSSGCDSSSASWSTRSLNCSHDSSRLK